MPQPCSIPNCKNSIKHDGWFIAHKFPKDKVSCDLWMASFRNAGITKNFQYSSIICGEHFIGGKKTTLNSVPTIFPSNETELPLDEDDVNNLEVDIDTPEIAITKSNKRSCNCQNLNSNKMKEKLSDLENQISQMNIENRELKKCIDKLVVANRSLKQANDRLEKNRVSMEALAKYEEIIDHPNRLEYYTGFRTKDDFNALFDFVEPDLISNKATFNLPRNNILPLKTQLLIVLIKLRLNLDCIDLAYRFGVPHSFVNKYWESWIPVMHFRLSQIPTWPSPEICDKYRPSIFKKDRFDIVDGILHKFDITIANSSTDESESKTALIALAPNGFFMYASDLVPNTLTDKELIIETKVLDKFTTGRGVVIKRESMMEEECAKRNLTLVYSPTEQDGCMFEHVDSVTSKISYFRILSDTYDTTMFSGGSDELNSVWHICCALLNFIENYDKPV